MVVYDMEQPKNRVTHRPLENLKIQNPPFRWYRPTNQPEKVGHKAMSGTSPVATL